MGGFGGALIALRRLRNLLREARGCALVTVGQSTLLPENSWPDNFVLELAPGEKREEVRVSGSMWCIFLPRLPTICIGPKAGRVAGKVRDFLIRHPPLAASRRRQADRPREFAPNKTPTAVEWLDRDKCAGRTRSPSR